MRIAVTGGSGRIGRAVIGELVSRGHDVLNLDRCAPKETTARWVYIDLRYREQVQPVFEKVDAVIHLGEIPTYRAPMPTNEIYTHNTGAGAVVMQTAADLKMKRFIYTSTCQVYGCWDEPRIGPVQLPLDETHPLRPQNIYALSKVANEGYARWVSKAKDLSVAIFRLPWVMSGELHNHMFHWIENQKGPADGFQTYIRDIDVAKAYALAIENPRPGCEAYHLAAVDVASVVPIRKRLMEHNPEYPALPEDWPAFKSPVVTEKMREHFGWEPSWSVREEYKKRFGKEMGQTA